MTRTSAHGDWMDRETYISAEVELQEQTCSVCGGVLTTPYSYAFEEFDYCPYCGSRMDGEDDG